MKQQEQLTHQEIMTALSDCFRDLVKTEINHRNMPNMINRGKAAAQLVTAMHREQIMESRRQSGQLAVAGAQIQKLKPGNA